MRNRLYRSRDDRIIGGVAAGVADWFDLDPSLVRVGWVILALFSGGAFALIYLVMLIVVPEEPGDDLGWSSQPMPGTTPPADAPGSATGGTGMAAPFVGAEGDTTVAPGVVPEPAGAPAPSTTQDWSWSDSRAQRRAERAARRAERRAAGPGAGGLIFGLILILVGGYFLLRQYVPQLDIDVTWPVIVIVLGVVLLLGALRPGGRSDG